MEIENTEMMQWLEKAVKHIMESQDDIYGLCLAAVKSNTIETSYYGCTEGDKILISGYVQQDATMDNVYNILEDLLSENEEQID